MLIKRVRNFARNEDGAITPLLLVLFTSIVLMTGVAIDLLRHEAARADLQAALDRGVLAAASLSQTLEADAVVADYVENRIWADIPVALSVDPTAGAGGTGRRIEASASFMLDSMFLKIAGLDQLRVAAASAAQQSATLVEISLVLDISGSMGRLPEPRLFNLQPAAVAFVEDMLDDGADQYVSINLVPYSGMVNPGPDMFGLLTAASGGRRHANSSCVEFDRASDFDETGLRGASDYAQVPHFQYFSYRSNTTLDDWGWCPDDETRIRYLSNDATLLGNVINGLRLHDGTGTQNAMKWAIALLDPDTRDRLGDLAAVRETPGEFAFADRPYAWDRPDVRKIIVLMTDGNIRYQRRPKNPNDPRLANTLLQSLSGQWYELETEESSTQSFLDLCDLAKENGVEIFTIAFEAGAEAEGEMEACASDIENFYAPVGSEITGVFEDIAVRISRLKLVN